MTPRTLKPKKPTLTTVVSLMMSLHKELKIEIKDLRNEVKGELREVRETVEFLKDNALVREEAVTKDELVDFKSDVIGHIDHFVQLHKKQELELVAVTHRVTRHEETFHTKQ